MVMRSLLFRFVTAFLVVLGVLALGGLPAQTAQPKRVICIDPGHPSEVGRGTQGKLVSEIRAAWKVALKLKQTLTLRGYSVTLTKEKEESYVTNRCRAEIAAECGAALMIRLHCDAEGGHGIATYYPDRQARNAGVLGPSKEVLRLSNEYAARFHPAMIHSLNGLLSNRGLMTDRSTAIGAKQGALTGSIHSKVPVFLIEMAVLTNPGDEKIIASERGQLAVAKAMADGIDNALKTP